MQGGLCLTCRYGLEKSANCAKNIREVVWALPFYVPRLPKNGPLTVFTTSISPSIRHSSIKGLTQPNSLTLEEMTPQKPITVDEISVSALDFDADVDLWTGSANQNCGVRSC